MENVTEPSTNSQLEELLSKYNFESLCKTKNNVQSKSTTYLPINKAINIHTYLTDVCIPTITIHPQPEKLQFLQIPGKVSDEPTHLSDDLFNNLQKKLTLESDYHMIEMNEMLESLDMEIQCQFRKMAEFSRQINSLPAPKKDTRSHLPNKLKTLALDLDETLIHSISGNDLFFTAQYQKIRKAKLSKQNITFVERPFLQQFLKELSSYYNIIVYVYAVIYGSLTGIC